MNVPLPGPSDAQERSRHSPVDSPYTSARSPSGHLIPYSPTPTRRHSGDISWMTGGQIPFHEEPGEINSSATRTATADDSNIPSSSCTTLHPPGLDIVSHQSHPPSPLHRTIGFTPQTSPGNPEVKSSPSLADLRSVQRSRTPLSTKSSQHTASTQGSRISIGRASYREHHGPPARVHTPVPHQEALVFSPPNLATTEPGSAAFPTIIAAPREDDPSRPGDPISICPRFFPMSVSGVVRYKCRMTRRPSESDHTIEAMFYQYPETPENVPSGWTAYRHPEGALYYVHTESKTITEVNICDDDIYSDINYFKNFLLSELQTEIRNRNLTNSLKADEVQLILEPKTDDLGLMCCYYFVNPRTRCLFWLDTWDGYDIFKDCKGYLSLPHKGIGIQAQYWSATYVRFACFNISMGLTSHWDLYPNFCEVTQELKDEVVDMILHATCDHLTSNRSSCPLNPEELKKHLSLIEQIDPAKTSVRKHSAIIIGRIMHIFYNNYFLNYYGEDCARLNFDQSIFGWRYHPSLFMSIFAPLSFMAPVKNVRLLHRIFVDHIASKEKWNSFVANLNSQLQETSVLATVLLNANVAFLPKESGTGISPQQFLSYMSLVASVASIILGLVFMGHIRTEARNTAFKAAKFLHGLWQEKHGLEVLAIVYSLPHVFLMWGMGLFSAAFVVEWFALDDIKLHIGASAFILVVATLVAWCLWTARDQCDFWWFQPEPTGDDSDDEAPLWLHLLHRVKASMTSQRTSKSHVDECPAMHDKSSLPDQSSIRSSSNSERKF